MTTLNSHTPQRMCIGCRERAPKNTLIRMGAAIDDKQNAVVEFGAHSIGRGAYVHAVHECIERASKIGNVARALRNPRINPQKLAELAGINATQHRQTAGIDT